MTIEQITTLVNAGFTKDEIMAMTAPAQAQAQQTAQEPAQKQEPAQQTAPAQEPAQQTAPAQEPAQQTAQEPKQQEISLSDVIKSNQQVMENITKLTAAVQANAIRTAVQPNGVQPEYTADQAIAEIIAPPRKERT